ncbi:unnamed protein product [Meloidogyne enterolobii]|uniref:Uncharacterized protein n=1 Tax=Meloidogyne enterolobii TaxID=390850 RepID=A0ACB0YKI8_MELEN
MEKWKTALDKSIPLFLHGLEDDSEDFAVLLKKPGDSSSRYILKLPNFPKTIEEMVIVRFWLEQLFNCAFEYAKFENIMFNPEMISLLFDDDKTILKQFHIQTASMDTSNVTIENFLKFGLNRLAICHKFSLSFNKGDLLEQHTDILFNLIINEGNKLPRVSLPICDDSLRLYNLVIEYVTTSQDCSKMVPVIALLYDSLENFKLPERAENVENNTLMYGLKTTKYEISNIYDPKVKFLFENNEDFEFTYVFIINMDKCLDFDKEMFNFYD